MTLEDRIKNIDPRMMLLIISIFLVISFVVIVSEFRRIDMNGVRCAKDPLKFAEQRMEQVRKEPYYCGCDPNPIKSYFQEDPETLWNPLNSS